MNAKQKRFSLNGAVPKGKFPAIGLAGEFSPGCTGRMKQTAVTILFGAFLFIEAFSFAQSPPLNDNFENRIVLTGSSVTFTGTLQNATIQLGESPGEGTSIYPIALSNSASVWWSWTASISEPVTFELLNFSPKTSKRGVVDVWTGIDWSSGFTFVAGVGFDTGRHPFLTFPATAGTTYQLRAVGTNYGDFTLRITETNTPIIVIQPFSRTVSTNGSVFFGVVAAGNPPASPPFSCQWRFNGVDIPGETFPILSLDNLTTNQSGGYSVMVSNAVSGTLSDVATLKVTEGTASPRLTPIGSANGQFDFGIQGEIGQLYRIQSSTNLVNWFEEKSFPQEFIYYETSTVRARNGLVYNNQNLFSAPQTARQKFYRTTGYVPPLAACINNLAQIRFAKEIWSLEHKQISWSTPGIADIAPYLNQSGVRGRPACPLAGPNGTFAISYIIGALRANPVCMYSFSHVLEEPEY